MKRSDFFYCYDLSLAKYIKSKGIETLTAALHPSTMQKFYMFERSDKLKKAIDEYNSTTIHKQG